MKFKLNAKAKRMPSSRPNLPCLTAALLLACCAVAACKPAAVSPGTGAGQLGDAARGQRLLVQYQCGSCHAIPGVAASRGLRGPSLEAFGKRSYIAGRVPNNPQAIAQWIASPAALVPDTTMPSMGVSPEEARDMAAYIGSLQ